MIDAQHLKALAEFLDGLTDLSTRTGVVIHTGGRRRPDVEVNGTFFALDAAHELDGVHYAIDTETDD